MTILILVYAISWLLILAIIIVSVLNKRIDSSDKQPWYFYILILVFAPLIAVCIPYILISSFIKEKEQRKIRKEREQRETEEKAIKQRALEELKAAMRKPQENHSFAHAMTAQTLVDKIKEKDFDSFMQYLDHLTLPKGASLHVEECRQEGMGDESRLFVETPEGAYDLNIWDYIKVENNIDGAWDAYFLSKVWHILPLWWHANYDRRTYMYSKEDADSIQLLAGREGELLKIQRAIKQFICEPEVIEAANGKYYVRCCYWTDFGGLIKETVEVLISAEGKVSFKDIEQNTLYQYECGIMF